MQKVSGNFILFGRARARVQDEPRKPSLLRQSRGNRVK